MAASSQRSPNTNANDATISPNAIPITRSRVIALDFVAIVIVVTSVIRTPNNPGFSHSPQASATSHSPQASATSHSPQPLGWGSAAPRLTARVAKTGNHLMVFLTAIPLQNINLRLKLIRSNHHRSTFSGTTQA